MKTLPIVLSAFAACLFPVSGQVYLIQGSPTPTYIQGYPTSLLQLSSDGGISRVSQVLPGSGKDGGTEWIGMSYEARKAVVRSRWPNHTIVVVDFDTASVDKTCEAPPAPTGMTNSPFEEWLADIPGKGLVYVEHFGTADSQKLIARRATRDDHALVGMIVDPATPCDKSFAEVSTNDIKYLVADGPAGVADLGARNSHNAMTEKDGSVAAGWDGGERTYFGYRVPSGLIRDIASPITSVALNDSEAFAAVIADASTNPWRIVVFRKGDSTWHTIPGAPISFVGGFGSIIALTEKQAKTAGNAASAGRGEWRMTEAATGPSIEERFKDLPYVIPGKLDLYDVATEKMYSIVTNQGDSEILLVDNGTVYYRVSDRLYSAAIGKDGLEPAKLLAKSESIRDMFTGRS